MSHFLYHPSIQTIFLFIKFFSGFISMLFFYIYEKYWWNLKWQWWNLQRSTVVLTRNAFPLERLGLEYFCFDSWVIMSHFSSQIISSYYSNNPVVLFIAFFSWFILMMKFFYIHEKYWWNLKWQWWNLQRSTVVLTRNAFPLDRLGLEYFHFDCQVIMSHISSQIISSWYSKNSCSSFL